MTYRLSTVALLIALQMSAEVQACELIYNENWRLWRGECALTIDPKGPLIKNEIAIARTSLKLPDLQIDKLKFRLIGNSLDVHADILNDGTATSPATVIELLFTFSDPLSPGVWSESTRRAVVPSLAPMATQRVFVSTFTINHSNFDVDVLSVGMVDPVTTSQPVRGLVSEVIESNNDVMHLCRVYGPLADTSVRPCD